MYPASFSRARCVEDLAAHALSLEGAHTIYAHPGTAGVLEGIIERAGGAGRITIEVHHGLLPGHAVAARRKDDGGGD
jgi:hypothetical protein